MYCRHCNEWTSAKWCKKPECQTAKDEHWRELRRLNSKGRREDRDYKNECLYKNQLVNGRKCRICGKPLKGYFFYHCPGCLGQVDDYGMQRGVCL